MANRIGITAGGVSALGTLNDSSHASANLASHCVTIEAKSGRALNRGS